MHFHLYVLNIIKSFKLEKRSKTNTSNVLFKTILIYNFMPYICYLQTLLLSIWSFRQYDGK